MGDGNDVVGGDVEGFDAAVLVERGHELAVGRERLPRISGSATRWTSSGVSGSDSTVARTTSVSTLRPRTRTSLPL
jgi:hypothetical protein